MGGGRVAELARLQALRRAVAHQCRLRDRAAALRAGLDAQARQIEAREADVLRALDAGCESALHGFFIAGAARRLDALACDRAALDARVAAATEASSRHARIARAGETRLARLAQDAQRQTERALLEDLAERFAVPASPGQVA